MKRIILFLLLLLCFSTCTKADDNLRTLFQNNKAVIYSVNLRTFNANDINGNGIIDFSNSETSGSFFNAVDRLDELKTLGINAIHLLPIN